MRDPQLRGRYDPHIYRATTDFRGMLLESTRGIHTAPPRAVGFRQR